MPRTRPRIVLAGANSGAGKTTLSIGLMAAWTLQGHTVQPFKVGPDFIDPAFHGAVTGRPSRNLDAWLVPEPELVRLFARHAPEQGLSVIEGVMGLYDGLGNSAFAGTAHVAALLEAPVVLVVNAEGMALSAAALVSGYARFRPGNAEPDLSRLRIGGVILNRIAGERHYTLLREAVEQHTGVSCFGWLPKNLPSLPHRHLGLVPAGEQQGLFEHVELLARAVTDYVDLPGLLRLAESAPPEMTEAPVTEKASETEEETRAAARAQNAAHSARPRIGLARDAAFSFYYPDNLECLEELGAELVPCSPLADAALPDDLDGLYLGGGFPEVFAERLEANAAFRASVKAALEGGMPAYAECGGMLYLCASLAPQAKPVGAMQDVPARAMAGLFPAHAAMTGRLQPFGYVTVTLERDCPLGPAGTAFRAHEFHYSQVSAGPGETGGPLIRSEKPDGRAWTGGMTAYNTVAWYPHLHFRGCSDAAQSFVSACRAFRRQRLVTP